MLVKDLSVDLGKDRPGVLAKAFDTIAKAGINIDGYAQIGSTLHVLTPDAAGARRALEPAGFSVQKEEDVAVGHVEDRAGIAANVFRQIADAGVSVTFSYVGTGNRLIVGASNVPKVAEILAKEGAVT